MFKKAAFFLLYFFLVAWTAGYIFFVLDVLSHSSTSKDNTQSDAIIVLTGGNNRVNTGLELFGQKKISRLFITGVHESVKDEEIIALWNGNDDLPCCVELGREATTTIENAIEAKEWIEKNDIKSILLVTSAYHMNRSVLEFSHLMPELQIDTYPVQEYDAPLKQMHFWKLTFSEYNKVLFRTVQLFITDHLKA